MSLRKWRALSPEDQTAAKSARPDGISRQVWRWLIMHGADKIEEIKKALAEAGYEKKVILGDEQ